MLLNTNPRLTADTSADTGPTSSSPLLPFLLQHKAADEVRREEVRAARRDADDLSKKLAGSERRCVQMQHEIRRKEKEYERLQER